MVRSALEFEDVCSEGGQHERPNAERVRGPPVARERETVDEIGSQSTRQPAWLPPGCGQFPEPVASGRIVNLMTDCRKEMTQVAGRVFLAGPHDDDVVSALDDSVGPPLRVR
jgi:hypothetical protein